MPYLSFSWFLALGLAAGLLIGVSFLLQYVRTPYLRREAHKTVCPDCGRRMRRWTTKTGERYDVCDLVACGRVLALEIPAEEEEPCK